MIEFYKANKDNIDKVVLFLFFLIGIFLFIKFAAVYFAPFLFGYIFSIFLFPFARFLQTKFKMSKALSAVISMLVLFAFVGTAAAVITSKLVYEARVLYENMPVYTQAIIKNTEKIQRVVQNSFEHMPYWFREQLNSNSQKLIQLLTSGIGSSVKTNPVDMVKSAANVVMVIIFGFISCFFIIKDKQEIDSFFYRQTPEAVQKRLKIIKTGLVDAVSGYIRAQVIMMLIVGGICALGLFFLGSPYALLLAVVIAFMDALPVFGSGAVFWPWALYCVINGDIRRAFFIIIINIIVLLTRHLTEPKILGGQIGLNPLVTLTSIYFGLRFFGFVGIIIGPMIVLVVKAMQEAELLPKWR